MREAEDTVEPHKEKCDETCELIRCVVAIRSVIDFPLLFFCYLPLFSLLQWECLCLNGGRKRNDVGKNNETASTVVFLGPVPQLRARAGHLLHS